MAIYLMCLYAKSEHSDWFRQAWARTGKKLDMGKCSVQFKKLDALALDVIGEAIQRLSARQYIALCEAATSSDKKRTRSTSTRSEK